MTRADPNEMSFFEHLEELRGRLIKSVLIWIVVLVVCLIFMKPIFDFLSQPWFSVLEERPFAAVDIKEPFYTHLKAAFWVSIILSAFLVFYQIWAFISPGLEKAEKNFARPFLAFMCIFFFLGCWFCFSVVFPEVLTFLREWNQGGFEAYTRDKYFSLLFGLVMGMGACFQTPMVVFLLARVGLVTPRFLMAKFKYAVLIIFVIAAFITPTPDAMTLMLLAIPMIGLYLLGVGAAFVVVRKKKEKSDGTAVSVGDEA